MIYTLLAGGLYLSAIAFYLDTKNFKSAIIFKIIPGLLGFSQIAFALSQLNIL